MPVMSLVPSSEVAFPTSYYNKKDKLSESFQEKLPSILVTKLYNMKGYNLPKLKLKCTVSQHGLCFIT